MIPGVIMLFRLLFYTVLFFCGSWEAFLDQMVRRQERFEMRYHVLHYRDVERFWLHVFVLYDVGWLTGVLS